MAEIKLADSIIEGLGLTARDVRQIPALTLAYLGDAVYEIVVRTLLVEQGIMHVSDLNKTAVKYVKAASQKAMYLAVEQDLSEDELAAFKRGRNVKSNSCAKNASVTDYRIATGYEALIGFLYLEDRFDRILELIKAGIERREDL